jgi:hypothetical protein
VNDVAIQKSPREAKPLGRKNYGSIGHLPNSRMGPADHAVHAGQGRICCEKVRDRHDTIIVTEKLDGSNVGIARVGDAIHALGRAGYPARSSPHEQHRLFADWVDLLEGTFREMLQPGERLVGEWMAQAHGTLYSLPLGPFAAFDLMRDAERAPFDELSTRCARFDIAMPKLLHVGGALSVEAAMALHGDGAHGCQGDVEGAVWRVERKGQFDFMAKWVRPDKADGKFLPELSGRETVWNWQPRESPPDDLSFLAAP